MKAASMFLADSGKVSSVRTAFLLTLFIVLINWSYMTYQKQELQPIPESIVMLVFGIGGMKAFQGYNEKPLTSPPKSDTIKAE